MVLPKYRIAKLKKKRNKKKNKNKTRTYLHLRNPLGILSISSCKYDPLKRNVVPNPTIWSAGADLGRGASESLVKYP